MRLDVVRTAVVRVVALRSASKKWMFPEFLRYVNNQPIIELIITIGETERFTIARRLRLGTKKNNFSDFRQF